MDCSGCKCSISSKDSSVGSSRIKSADSDQVAFNNWLSDYEKFDTGSELVEVRFKNTRKAYFIKTLGLQVNRGDMVAVESDYGHDIGTVTLTGTLARLQVKKNYSAIHKKGLKKIYRKATAADMNVYRLAVDREYSTMIQGRQMIREAGLNMKLSDVEFQGDNTKATFYYIADGRVDFRLLIKTLAREFNVRIEMKQIGARQEAGRVGGIGSCGREQCCSSWKNNFSSVSTESAKAQGLATNAEKLAGQCGKLKCCLMYELDSYLDAQEEIPNTLLELELDTGKAYHVKTNILKRVMYYSLSLESGSPLISVPVKRVKEIITLNKKGIKPKSLNTISSLANNTLDFISTQDDLLRFETKPVRNNLKQRKKKINR